jgi:uncharacterized membrane-anchored protein
MKKHFSLFLLLISFSFVSFAKGEKDSIAMAEMAAVKYVDSVNTAMRYETGVIKLSGNMAQLNVPKGFKYLNATQSNFLLTEVWGNPPQDGVLGIIMPDGDDPFTQGSYAFIVSYDPMGFVKDEDADKIDYDDMLKDLQKDEIENNKQRKMEGYGSIHMNGWASKPFYDKDKKVLHWAKNLKFENSEENELNYEVRVLGRKGILSLVALSTMKELPLVQKDIDKVLAMASFTEGNQYKDFDSKIDNVAAWTVGGLVAGKVLLKVGFLAKFWKFIMIGIIAIFGFFKRLITGKKNDEPTAEAVPVDAVKTHIDQEQGRDPNVV